jgi:signal transduction histidine kinase
MRDRYLRFVLLLLSFWTVSVLAGMSLEDGFPRPLDADTEAEAAPQAQELDERPVLTIGVMAIRGPETALNMWKATADHLTEHIPGYRFVIEPLDFDKFRQAVVDRSVSFVLTNPGMYVEFESLHGARRIATLKNLRLGRPYNEFGAVIFRRADRADIEDIHDLRGKRFATVDETAFGGWQMAWRQMLELGFDPYRRLGELYSVGTHDQVVYEVLEGRADAGNVRTDTLERMEQEGRIRRSDFVLIHQNTEHEERFPFALSTRLYPEWPFAILPGTPQTLAEKVAIALMGIQPESAAARYGRYEGWTVPGNYEPVHETLRMLRVVPYENYGEVTWRAVLQKYWLVILGILLSLLLLALATIWFRRLNQQLSHTQTQLQRELVERRRAEESLREAGVNLQAKNDQLETTNHELAATLEQVRHMQQQIVQQEKMASLGMLTAGIAHEIKNPLNFIVNFSELSRDLAGELQEELGNVGERVDAETRGVLDEIVTDLKSNSEKIHQHGRRADSIVRNMLEHSRSESGEFRATDLNALLEEYVNLAYHGMRANDNTFNLTIERDYETSLAPINVVPQDLSRVFLNIINNGCYAVHERSKRGEPGFVPTLYVATRRLGDHVEIRIRDNGTGIPGDLRDKVFEPFFTTKPTGSGTGLGLSISYDIVVKVHHGRFQVDSEEGRFTEFRIELPAGPGADAGTEEA